MIVHRQKRLLLAQEGFPILSFLHTLRSFSGGFRDLQEQIGGTQGAAQSGVHLQINDQHRFIYYYPVLGIDKTLLSMNHHHKQMHYSPAEDSMLKRSGHTDSFDVCLQPEHHFEALHFAIPLI